jgi:histidinol-phosphate aminotransferase
MIRIPENIEALQPYVPGKPLEELERELGVKHAIKLASNENPLGPSPKAIAAAQAALAAGNLYPDGGGFRLRQAIAAKHGVSVDEVVLGAGSNELIELVVRAFTVPGQDEVITHAHAFMMYRVACGSHGVAYREAPVSAELGCDVDALAAATTARTRVVFLPNPNNPTGAYVPRPAFERLVERLPRDLLLVADEAYVEYASARPDYPIADAYRASFPGLVTLRTFSKAYGLAGLRVGYAICDARIAGYLNRVRMPFNVSSVAQEAARAALDDDEHVERSRRTNAEGMAQLQAGLAKLPVRVYPSAANFLLVDLGRDAGPVNDALLRGGVITRPVKAAGLPTCLRITVGTAAENTRALAALADVL